MKKMFLFIFIYRLIKNTVNFFRIKYLAELHFEYMKQKNSDIVNKSQEVISLFKSAKIKDSKIAVSQPLGYMQIANFEAFAFENFPTLDTRFVFIHVDMFTRAEGVFKKNIIDCFNPIFWIDSILFLPKHFLEYLGMNMDEKISKLLNVFIYIIIGITGYVANMFSAEIKIILENFFKKHF